MISDNFKNEWTDRARAARCWIDEFLKPDPVTYISRKLAILPLAGPKTNRLRSERTREWTRLSKDRCNHLCALHTSFDRCGRWASALLDRLSSESAFAATVAEFASRGVDVFVCGDMLVTVTQRDTATLWIVADGPRVVGITFGTFTVCGSGSDLGDRSSMDIEAAVAIEVWRFLGYVADSLHRAHVKTDGG